MTTYRTVKARGHARVHGRAYTPSRTGRRQRLGRVSGLLMAGGGLCVGLILAPTFLVPLTLMAFFVAVGGFVMDETASVGNLAGRLLGPVLALGGLVLVVWLLVSGGI